MWFAIFLITLAMMIPAAMAQSTGYVWTKGVPQVIKQKHFKGKNYRMLDVNEENRQFAEDGYVPPRERAALFHKLKLEDATAAMDDMDKDMLVMGAKFMKVEKLEKIYPHLTHDQLTKLSREVASKK